jgi:hypothetical protein
MRSRSWRPTVTSSHSRTVAASRERLGSESFDPRAGRSPWRAFYRRILGTLVIGAIGPEAHVDPRGFGRAIRAAEARLTQFEERRRHDANPLT